MNALLVSIAVATLGIDYGWQRLPEGGMQYIIQLNPQTLEALRAGQSIESDIPAGAGEVRSYRIIVGQGALPHDTPPPRLAMPDKTIPGTASAQGPALLAPPALGPSPGFKPASGQPAVFEEPEGKPVASKQPQAATKSAPQEPARPWLPLFVTVLGLFGSLAANVYLGWIALEFRQRCRALILTNPTL